MISIRKVGSLVKGIHLAILARDAASLPKSLLSAGEIRYLKARKKDKQSLVGINRLDHWVWVYFISDQKEAGLRLEDCRIKGEMTCKRVNDQGGERLLITGPEKAGPEALAFSEGIILGNYQFLKHRSDAAEKANSLKNLEIQGVHVSDRDLRELTIVCESVYQCRDLVNEPVNQLNAEELAAVFMSYGKEKNLNVEVMSKSRIEALKMGGLLAVNAGSTDPPTFTVMEYKPASAVNRKPYILVGKGVTFDTGGISLKPSTAMSDMKCDMSGAAAVGTALRAVAKAELPLWVIGLIPATDNRPSGNARVPGDIIRMYDGTSVEVLNTDAEGRLILADALAYAKKYKPALVLDIATLTGAANAAIGKYGIVSMGSQCRREMNLLKECGDKVHERIAEFPFWDDYSELLKSEVADLKNIGGPLAGAITAGKFLEHFTDYPYIHLDIAGPAYGDKHDSYRGKGGSGVGVRLFFSLMKALSAKKSGGSK